MQIASIILYALKDSKKKLASGIQETHEHTLFQDGQFVELVNHATNKGLSPNLCVDDTSMNFTMNGFDIAMAAYMSGLPFLMNLMNCYAISAEIGIQAWNSIALVGGQYTETAIELLHLMCASSLYSVH